MSNVDTTLLNSVSATGAGESLNTQDQSVAVIQITGTFTGTVTFQATLDGENWVSVLAVRLSNGAKASTATAAGIYVIPAVGLEGVRPNVTAYTSGNITAVGRVTDKPTPLAVQA